jgi:hypothetical protein
MVCIPISFPPTDVPGWIPFVVVVVVVGDDHCPTSSSGCGCDCGSRACLHGSGSGSESVARAVGWWTSNKVDGGVREGGGGGGGGEVDHGCAVEDEDEPHGSSITSGNGRGNGFEG